MLRLVQSAAGTEQLLGLESQNISEILFRRVEDGKILGYSWKIVTLKKA